MSEYVALNKTLNPNQVVALRVLACGGTPGEAAAAARISARTLGRWMTRPDFSDALRTMQATVLKSITSKLVGLADKAVDTLGQVLASAGASDNVKVRVAIATLDAAAKWREATVVEERLAALEKEVTKIRKMR